ncbi:MAG TPA: tetratricopeptide repeat protein [Candidatus Solibacter sp.]|nr:tetratricopeptide repeat protein [Candidatus Solibacter sp.]
MAISRYLLLAERWVDLPMHPSKAPMIEERLDSWKGVAGYLKRDVRTVQRWEKSSGLPVHRLHVDKVGSVYAYKSELDDWRNDRQSSLEFRPQPNWLSLTRAKIAVFSAVLAVFVGGLVYLRLHKAVQDQPALLSSLAVLPLENLTGDPSQEYLSDGITDALITRLAQLPGLRVISRTSTTHYKGTRKTLPEIARELHVAAIVEGSVTRSENKVILSAQVIQAETDTHIWAASYSRPSQEIPQLEGLVADDIVLLLHGRLPTESGAVVSNPPTNNPEAYEAYLRGIYFFEKQNPNDLQRAVRYFESAIQKDPAYAAAYAGRAECFLWFAFLDELPASEAYSRAQEAVGKALELNDNLDTAHSVLALIARLRDSDWRKAEAEYRRAIDLNPSSASAHLGYADLLLTLGRAEQSREHDQAARTFDPLSMKTLLANLAHSYYRREYVEGLSQARSALELYPDAPLIHVFLSNIYFQQGNEDLAAQETLRAEELLGGKPERTVSLQLAYQTSGFRGLRQKRIQLDSETSEQQSSNSYNLAIDYAGLGNKDQAMRWLERAYLVRDPKITVIGIEPAFDILRSDPRFRDLTRRIGLPLNVS